MRFGLGAGVEPQLHAAFEKRFGFPLIEVWGMTEMVRVLIDNEPPRQVGTRAFGRAGARASRCAWSTTRTATCRDGEPGEMVIRHSAATPRRGFFSGYLKDAAGDRAAWRGGWFHTGDTVRRGADGMLHFVDRKKNIIRRSGENIAAAEVEALLQAHPRVKQVAVLAVPDRDARGGSARLHRAARGRRRATTAAESCSTIASSGSPTSRRRAGSTSRRDAADHRHAEDPEAPDLPGRLRFPQPARHVRSARAQEAAALAHRGTTDDVGNAESRNVPADLPRRSVRGQGRPRLRRRTRSRQGDRRAVRAPRRQIASFAAAIGSGWTDRGPAGAPRRRRARTRLISIRDPEAVQRLYDRALRAFGKLDILVNNAGGQFPQAAIDFSSRAGTPSSTPTSTAPGT